MESRYNVVERTNGGIIYSGDNHEAAHKLAVEHEDHCTLYSAFPIGFETRDHQKGEDLTLSVRRYWGAVNGILLKWIDLANKIGKV